MRSGADNQQERPPDGAESSEAIRQTSPRAIAKATGAKTYHGRPCKHCGGTLRYTAGSCASSTCTRQRARESYRNRRAKFEGVEFLYRCYSVKGDLLYVGRTNHPHNRINTHRAETPWWGEVAKMRWVQVPDYEQVAILAEHPRYNKAKRRG